MLVIRKEQMEAFELASAPGFEAAAAQHLREAFPKHCGQLGPAGIEETVRYGRDRAAAHGIVTQAGATLFLDLMLLLGRGFDADLQLPWAARILADPAMPDEPARIAALHAKSMEYLEAVSGPDNEFIDEAQRRIGLEPPHWPSSPETIEAELLARFKAIFPEKCSFVGDEVLRALFVHSVETARKYDLRTSMGVVVIAGLAFMLGAGFDTDPVFGSINQVLHDRSGDAATRSTELYERSLKYLKAWCG